MYKHSVAKLLPTRHVMNVLPRLKLLNAMKTFTPLTVFLIKSFRDNKIYLHEVCSGFEPELPIHILTMLPEKPVTTTTYVQL
jgi:hypothetical protein